MVGKKKETGQKNKSKSKSPVKDEKSQKLLKSKKVT
jgi:hypothetical protein